MKRRVRAKMKSVANDEMLNTIVAPSVASLVPNTPDSQRLLQLDATLLNLQRKQRS